MYLNLPQEFLIEKQLKFQESPEFDTSEVRLRDICTRAQFVGSFKPGRKPKALMARLNPDPPALVPIGVTPTKNEFVDAFTTPSSSADQV